MAQDERAFRKRQKKKDCKSIDISFYFTFITSWHLQRLTLFCTCSFIKQFKGDLRGNGIFFPQHRQFFIDTNFETTRNTFPASQIDAAELKGEAS